MVFPQSTIPIPPFVFNPCGFGNMVSRNVWNHSADILRDINRISNQIHQSLNQPEANCYTNGPNCASSSASASGCKASAYASSSSTNSASSINGDTFEVKVDVQHFKPEEINVKLVDLNTLIIEGKHEERSDEHGFVSRSFSRRFIIPDSYDTEKLESHLSLNGVLTIKAPRKPIQGANGEKIIPITLTSSISAVGEPANKTPSETVPITKTTSNTGNNQNTNSEGPNLD